MPMFFSMYQGGMTPGLSRSPVRYLMARAQGRTSSYEMSDIGAREFGRWHFWQLRCRRGAISRLNVGSSGTSPADAAIGNASAMIAAAPQKPTSFEVVMVSNLTRNSGPKRQRSVYRTRSRLELASVVR